MKVGRDQVLRYDLSGGLSCKEVAGKAVNFTVTVNSVEAPRLPEIDADFVKSVGIADGDVSKLDGEIRSNLAREVTRRLGVRNKEAAMDALLKVTDFEVPQALLEWEMQALMEQTVSEMESRGINMKSMPLHPESAPARG